MLSKMFKKEPKIKTRIAPSPTGPFHLGTARTALFNYAFAKQKNGIFILRIEDTDQERSDKRFEEDIIKGLNWLGLEFDEFYRQSERKEIYKKYIEQLLKTGSAFWCYHTPEELNQEKRKQIEKRQPPRHICDHKEFKSTTINKKSEGIIRLKGKNKKIIFYDLVRGKIEFNAALLGDIALAKNLTKPFYNLAVVIDDQEMEISHIIRGEDHIPNTPKQILIQEALSFKQPNYAHIPLILNPDRTKLSKRYGTTALNEYKYQGYLPEALLNYMALLGWNPGNDKEIFSKEEFIKMFSFEKIQKAGAVFNPDKLNWFNRHYIKKMTLEELSEKIKPYLPQEWKEKIEEKPIFWKKILELEKERLSKLSEIKENTEFFFARPIFPKSLLLWKEENLENTFQHLDNLYKLLSKLKEKKFIKEEIKKAIWSYAEEKGRGNVLWPFRVALTGLEKSPDPFTVAEILGKEETLKRINFAKNTIYGSPQRIE